MTSEEYAKYFYQKTLTLEKEILLLKEEIKDLKSSNENLRLHNEDTCKRMNEYSQDYRNLYNNFDAEVKKQVANKIKIKERTFKANETKFKKEIDYLKKRINALLLDIEALRR